MNKIKLINKLDYKYFYPIVTRWMDNDIYGHINNVNYYSYFDTAVNQYLIDKGKLDIKKGLIVGFVVHSSCDYLNPISHPEKIEAGLVVKKIGNSSVTYGIGIFKEDEDKVSAYGEFIHVFVNRSNNKSVSIPKKIIESLKEILL